MSTGRTYRAAGTRVRKLVPRESAIQAACLRLARFHLAVAWIARQNSGVLRSPDGERMLRAGWTGAADLTGQLRDGRRLEVEVKRPGGRVTEHQRHFLEIVARHGGVAGVVRSIGDMKDLLDGSLASPGAAGDFRGRVFGVR
jgi:hypothetical protein